MTDQEQLRYPIGRFSASNPSIPAGRAAQIKVLQDLPQALRSAVAGLNEGQLDTPYRDGGWTVRQLVHHVADSHGNSFFRFKWALTEDWPTVKPYDEAAWARLADSRTLPVETSLAMTAALHERWVTLLESLSNADFQKGYNHPESGRQNLDTALAVYAWHSLHHTAHVTNLRARQGW
jgi:DinB superfamily